MHAPPFLQNTKSYFVVCGSGGAGQKLFSRLLTAPSPKIRPAFRDFNTYRQSFDAIVSFMPHPLTGMFTSLIRTFA